MNDDELQALFAGLAAKDRDGETRAAARATFASSLGLLRDSDSAKATILDAAPPPETYAAEALPLVLPPPQVPLPLRELAPVRPARAGGSLADRLALARQGRAVEESQSRLGHAVGTSAAAPLAHRRRAVAADPFGELKRTVHQSLLDNLGPKLYDSRLTQSDLETRVRQTLQEVLSAGEMPLTTADRARIAGEIADDILGYGPVEPYLRDPDISEIMVNGPDQIYIEKAGKIYPAEGRFADEAHLRRTIDKIVGRVGRRVDEASPMVDARLPDGSRINAIIPPLAVDGSLLTIRKFAADPFEVDDLVSFGTLTRSVADFLDACVRGRLNILVGGGTGAGKTTTLNVLSGFIPGDERVVTIEDAAELQLHQEHVLRLESRPSNIEGKGEVKIRDLVRNALRMRPDRIVVGEIRDAAALDMLQAMNTGHDGSICTVHANSPRDVLSRVETMVLMAGMDLPIKAIREQLASALDLIVHQTRDRDGSRRITHITEVIGMEGDIITLQDLFVFDHTTPTSTEPSLHGQTSTISATGPIPPGSLRPTGLRPHFLDRLAHSGVTIDPRTFAFEQVLHHRPTDRRGR